MQNPRRILFISRAFTTRPETQSTGLFVRFKTLLKGAANTGAEIRILFLVNDPTEIEPNQHAAWEARLSDFFGIRLTFALCQFEPDVPASRNTVLGVLKGALSMHWQSDYGQSLISFLRNSVIGHHGDQRSRRHEIAHQQPHARS